MHCGCKHSQLPSTAQLLADFTERGAASDGSCCPEDQQVQCQGCQRGLRQPRKVRDDPAGPHSHSAWDTEEMAVW